MAFKRLFADFPDKNLNDWLAELQRRLESGFDSSAQTHIVYRPGAPSSANQLSTWAEVMAAIENVENATIVVDTSQQDPIGTPAPVPPGTYDMRFADLSSVALPTELAVLDIQDGAVLQNLRSVQDGLGVHCRPTTGPCFTFPAFAGAPQVFTVYKGALINNFGTVPALEADGSFLVVAAVLAGVVGPQSGAMTVPLASAVNGATVAVVSDNGVWADNWLSGDPSSSLVYQALSADFRSPPPAIPLFLGSVLPVGGYRDRATGVVYTPANNPNWNNDPPATVQQALDRIAALVGPIP